MTVSTFAKGVFRRANSKAGRTILAVLFFIALLAVAFFLGDHRGAKRQYQRDLKRNPNSRTINRSNTNAQKHASAFGSVTQVDAKSIEVKSNTNKTTKFKIESSTSITGADGKKVDANALKKDQKVIVTGNVNSDSTNTATRIHIQK